jgi:hypothetical protein
MVTIDDYDKATTSLCERALVTVLGNIGMWSDAVYLVGGLTPRYLVPGGPDTPPHVGTNDVDLGIVLAVEDVKAYATLEKGLVRAGFKQRYYEDDPSFRWRRMTDQGLVTVEFLCDADSDFGRMTTIGHGTGHAFQALRVEGVRLVARDYIVRVVERERLDDRGISSVSVRVASLLPFTALKIQAFQSRHNEKDAYDLVYCLLHHEGGPEGAAQAALSSPIRDDPFVTDSLRLLGERFETALHDGPAAYAAFMAGRGQANPVDAQSAVEAIRLFLQEMDRA